MVPCVGSYPQCHLMKEVCAQIGTANCRCVSMLAAQWRALRAATLVPPQWNRMHVRTVPVTSIQPHIYD